MELLGGLFREYGLWLPFGGILLEALGVPIPGEAVLLLAGVLAARGEVSLLLITAVAALAVLGADSAWFLLGRRRGMAILGLVCRLTHGSDRCVRLATQSFRRWGRLSVLVGKFAVGFRMTIPPLAGAMRMPYGKFLALDLVGASAWASLFASLGYTFHRQIAGLLQVVKALNMAIVTALVLATLALLAKRLFSLPRTAAKINNAVAARADSDRA